MERLDDPKNVLVIAGHAGDEGVDYLRFLKQKANKSKARVLFVGKYVSSRRKIAGQRRVYTLWDAYNNSDFVTYPTGIEGYGNQFVESVYFKKPVILTEYPVFKKDIKPLGFKYLDIFDKRLKQKLADKKALSEMVEHNFRLGVGNFSYESTWEKMEKVLKGLK